MGVPRDLILSLVITGFACHGNQGPCRAKPLKAQEHHSHLAEQGALLLELGFRAELE